MSKFMCGWLDRTGKFYPCDEYQHNGLAEEIIDVNDIPYIYQERYGFLRGESLLDHIGYIKIVQSNFFKMDLKYDCGRIYYCSKHRMTKEQLDWLIVHKEEFSHEQLKCFNDIMKEEMRDD